MHGIVFIQYNRLIRKHCKQKYACICLWRKAFTVIFKFYIFTYELHAWTPSQLTYGVMITSLLRLRTLIRHCHVIITLSLRCVSWYVLGGKTRDNMEKFTHLSIMQPFLSFKQITKTNTNISIITMVINNIKLIFMHIQLIKYFLLNWNLKDTKHIRLIKTSALISQDTSTNFINLQQIQFNVIHNILPLQECSSCNPLAFQITNTLGLTLIGHQSDTFTPGWYLD